MQEDPHTKDSSTKLQIQWQEMEKSISGYLRNCKMDSWVEEWANKPTKGPGFELSAYYIQP
jgi:hypothetical protein